MSSCNRSTASDLQLETKLSSNNGTEVVQPDDLTCLSWLTQPALLSRVKSVVTEGTGEKNRHVASVEESVQNEEKLLKDLLAKKFQILQRTSVRKLCHHFQVLSQV